MTIDLLYFICYCIGSTLLTYYRGDTMDKKILVVDDDKQLRETIKEILQEKGYRVVAASNGQEAIKIIEKNGWIPDLVLTDYNMPIINGITLVSILKDNSQIPIILMTGAVDVPENKADMTLTKPIKTDYLLKSMDICLHY